MHNNSNSIFHTCYANIPGYVFESAGVGLFIDETLSYGVLENISNENFSRCGLRFLLSLRKALFAASYTGSIIHLNALSNNILMKQLNNLLLRENTL